MSRHNRMQIVRKVIVHSIPIFIAALLVAGVAVWFHEGTTSAHDEIDDDVTTPLRIEEPPADLVDPCPETDVVLAKFAEPDPCEEEEADVTLANNEAPPFYEKPENREEPPFYEKPTRVKEPPFYEKDDSVEEPPFSEKDDDVEEPPVAESDDCLEELDGVVMIKFMDDDPCAEAETEADLTSNEEPPFYEKEDGFEGPPAAENPCVEAEGDASLVRFVTPGNDGCGEDDDDADAGEYLHFEGPPFYEKRSELDGVYYL